MKGQTNRSELMSCRKLCTVELPGCSGGQSFFILANRPRQNVRHGVHLCIPFTFTHARKHRHGHTDTQTQKQTQTLTETQQGGGGRLT